jgi:hypothetical protein
MAMNRREIRNLFWVPALLCVSAFPVSGSDSPAPEHSADAEAAPTWFIHREEGTAQNGPLRTVVGRLKADPDRAKKDAREELGRAVQTWLMDAGIPRSWTASRARFERLVVDSHVEKDERPYGTLYLGAVRADFSPERRDQFMQEYEHDLVGGRLAVLTGVLAFVLISLAGLAGYIRADEATKGYYTNRLRLAAAAGVGAAGVAIYKVLT